MTTTFFRLTKAVAIEMIAANLSAAEWRISIALLAINPWQSEVFLPEEIKEIAHVSTATLYRALNKLKALGWFDFCLSIKYRTLLGTTLAPAHVLGYRGDDTKGGNHAQAILTDENPTLTVEKEVLTDENPILTDEKNFLTAEKNFLANEKEILTDENSILTGEKATGLKPIQGKASTTPKIIDKDLLDPLDQEELERDEDLNPSELKEKARLASSLQEFKESIGSYAFLKFISYVKAEHPSVKNLDAYLFKAWKDLVQGWVDTLPMIVQPPRPSLDELKRLYPKSWQKAAKHFGY